MSQHGKLLRAYRETVAKKDDTLKRAVVGKVLRALHHPIMVAEAVRLDTKLASNPETSGIYGAMWQIPPAKSGETVALKRPPKRIRNLSTVVLFLGYMRTQSALMTSAIESPDDRLELVKRFARFTGQLRFEGTIKQGDQEIRDQPAMGNYPAFPSIMKPLSGQGLLPLETPTKTDHRFEMQVQFPSVYEALGRYAFNWEIVRIPDDKIGTPVDVEKLEGDQIGNFDIAVIRFDRTTAYAKEDIKEVVENMKTDLGAPGVGALNLVGANAILRYIGTGIRLVLDILTKPLNQKLIPFKKAGLFMVRAAMSQVLEGNEEVVRAPSVAYYPVLVGEAEDMAVRGVSSSLSVREKNERRIEELKAALDKGGLEEKERRQLEKELN